QKGKPQPPRPAVGGNVRFMPDRTQNRVIITAPPDRLPDILHLIETLDQDKPADVAIRVLQLRHVEAADLVSEIAPMYQKIRGQSLKDTIEISANSRSNSLIVLSSQKNFEAIEELIKALDTEEAESKAMKSFSLKNADAEEIAEHLTELYQPGQRSSRYYGWGYYDYGRRSRSTRGEVKFVADRRRNSVIVIGPSTSFESIGRMIEALDEAVDSDSLLPRIYRLKFVSAFDVEEILDELFTKRTRQRGYYDREYGYDQEDRDVGKLYGKVRVTSEFYTNSIIVTSNSEENFKAVEDIIKQLDVPSDTGDTTVTIRLKHARAVTVANNLNIIFAQGGAPPRGQRGQPQRQGQQNNQQPRGRSGIAASFELKEEIYEDSYFPWLGSAQQDPRGRGGTRTSRPVSDLVGKVRVVPDIRTNALLISSNAHLLSEILQVVNDLDVPTPQVLIEAKIIEVTGDLRDRMGVRWSPDGSQIFDVDDLDNSFIGEGGVEYTEVFAGSLLQNAMRSGVLNASANLDLLVQFLRKNTESRVLAEPRINVADHERGKIFIGSRIPFISGSLTTVEGGRNDSFEYIDVGIILEVTPQINDNGDVALGIRVEASQIRPGETLFGGAIIDTRNYRTDMTVKSGQTLVLGGIIQKEQSKVERKVPILGDIPLLGWFFKKVDIVDRDVELMVFLRLTVTRTEEEVEALMESERSKTPSIEAWKKMLEAERREEN
ncbi:MAG: hypothetical protein O7J95_21820, partial [Planctomycetota bacterium]|nr:hypothetical protein [Planctomycetota bacterium]